MPEETESGASLLARREYARAVPLLKREHEKYMDELNQYCTRRAIPYFRTDTRVAFDELVLRIFRQGGFLR